MVTPIIGISPLERADAALVAAVCDAGALGILDLGRDPTARARALAALGQRAFGVRVPDDEDVGAVPAHVQVVIASAERVAEFLPRCVIAQVTSLAEARAAVAAGARGLIAKGSEAGGRIADETTFVLLQHLLGECTVPVWAQGGIGPATAAACVAGGAAGVVLDSQLALVRESALPADVQAAIAAMDGSETVIVAGHRVYARPDRRAALLALTTEDLRARLGRDDLATAVLPVGQDGALARPLARTFPTAAQLVHGIRNAIEDQLAAAARLQPLAPGAPLAASHGVRYPIAQGPMSRVSDRAQFAAAVASAGGLPFLALTLMSGPEVRALLLETRALLGERPWGVGILGFVPAEVRDQQLAVMREIAPPVALIAGGRPAQAAPLEALGTAVYLHVPSPGLLDLFLAEGARRFVFEGSECGGHVGPRSSFLLWEQQITRLLAHPDPGELAVLFAGGIHDARSAAMVAAMAAPLAARGARIGVLMGTAYLFTHEAIAAGAIEPAFQDVAIACERTVLLETSPGHATRCAQTAYAEAFARDKQQLAAAGVAAKAMWERLEQQNLGRLRIAAKGLVRRDDRIERVETTAQLRDGMYMIGQVAALRRAACSIAELHRDVSVGGSQLVAAARPAERAADAAPACDVAVIGIAAIFPGAPDTARFWSNILAGTSAIREVPAERWSAAQYYDPGAVGSSREVGKKTPCKWGGFLDDVAFDPLAFGIPPKSLSAIEPVQLLALEVARRALADAGYAERAFDRERTAVIFGAEAGADLLNAYSFRAVYPHYVGTLPAALDAELPALTEDSFPGILANVTAGRIANRLDLGGVNYAVDAACAASLAAVYLAVQELRSGTSDMVLCGGADLHNGIADYLLFSSVHALSPSGRCRTFDADADGIVLGEGVACVVLKRVADAERDGDRIYAVLKAVAGSSDGRSLGLTAPRKDGQERALDRAYRQAAVSPARVGLVEAHGTGTVVGDRTELASLTEVYTRAGAAPGACVLGSVKSQIGHTKCAAGMAGLIKAALSVYHGVLPPAASVTTPTPGWRPDESPFTFLDRPRAWPAADRIAAVSSFGFGGANFHAVLASHPSTGAGRPAAVWPAELVLLRGADRAAAMAMIERVEALVSAGPTGARLCDIARTVSAGSAPVQIAIVAESLDDLRDKLALARAGTHDPRGVFIADGAHRGALAFVCPGQGSQKVGMLADLFIAFPRLRRWLELGAKWVPAMYPAAPFTDERRAAQAAALTDTRVAQPALGIASMAVIELLGELGVRPDLVAGHSYGELVALCAAGALDEAELLALSEARGEAITAAVAAAGEPGTMAAVAAAAEVVAPIVRDADVVIANANSPQQCVVSGSTAGIDDALARLADAGLLARRIPVACAFHSPRVAGARPALARRLAGLAVHPPRIPVWSNTTARSYPAEPDQIRALLADQVAQPVQFARQIEAMYEAGARLFVETGPGQVLTRLIDEILGARPHLAIACDGGPLPVLRAVAALAVSGVAVDPAPLFRDRDAAIIGFEAPPARPPGWLVNGHSSRPATAGPLAPARPIAITTAAPEPPAIAARDGAVLEYLRTMRQAIAAQRDVMLTLLGAAPAPRAEREPAPPPRAIDMSPAVAVAPAAVAAGASGPPAAIDPRQLVISIVSDRTGYPLETLGGDHGLDLDLEADLGIDSIKRVEIVGALAHQLGLRADRGAAQSALVEELAAHKTLRTVVAWLAGRIPATGPVATEAEPPPGAPDAPSAPTAASAPVRRYRLELVDAPPPPNGRPSLAGKRFAIFDGQGASDAGEGGPTGSVAARLAARLVAEGATARRIGPGEPLGEVDGLVDLSAHPRARLPAGDSVTAMREMFERVRDAAVTGVRWILLTTTSAREHGEGGPAGLIKTVAAEWPDIQARVVDLGTTRDPAEILHAELHADDRHLEVSYARGDRASIEIVPAQLDAVADVGLDKSSVVLVTGGARGITAKVAIAIARRYGCRIELVGRSALPADEDPALARITDPRALRAALANGGATPAESAQRTARVLADREIRATLASLDGRATYHAVDVRTPAFGALIDELYRRYGRIDGVIHGAGVLEDKLIQHKTAASFERVFATKVVAARTLIERLRDDVKIIVLFSSISGALGNRGQVDYAAAGDSLDKLAWSLQRRSTGRVVSIDWGPWAGAGMVSPELARDYARRGIGLIDPARGVEALLAELGAGRDAQVILTASDPRALTRARDAGQAGARDA